MWRMLSDVPSGAWNAETADKGKRSIREEQLVEQNNGTEYVFCGEFVYVSRRGKM